MGENSKKYGKYDARIPVINLANAPGEGLSWGRSKWMVYGWGVVELLLVQNPWQISSSLRVRALRAFGAEIGEDVIMRPRIRVRFPWNLKIGDRSWIGEGVWIHNQDVVEIGSDAVISQEAFVTTGSHAMRRDMALITAPIFVDSGAWITSRAIILGGSHIGRSAVVTPNSVVGPKQVIEPGTIVSGSPAVVTAHRFLPESSSGQ